MSLDSASDSSTHDPVRWSEIAIAAVVVAQDRPRRTVDPIGLALTELRRDPAIVDAAVLLVEERDAHRLVVADVISPTTANESLAALSGKELGSIREWSADVACGRVDDLASGPLRAAVVRRAAAWWGSARLRGPTNSCLGVLLVAGRGDMPMHLPTVLSASALVLASTLVPGRNATESRRTAPDTDRPSPRTASVEDPADKAVALIVDRLDDPVMYVRSFGTDVRCNAAARNALAVGAIALRPADSHGRVAIDASSSDLFSSLLGRALVDFVERRVGTAGDSSRQSGDPGRHHRVAPVTDPSGTRLDGFVIAFAGSNRAGESAEVERLSHRLATLAEFLDARLGMIDRSERDDLRRLGLTERQCDVAELLLFGARVPAISTRLGVSQATVRAHLRGMFDRSGVTSQWELTDWLRSSVRHDDPPAGQRSLPRSKQTRA